MVSNRKIRLLFIKRDVPVRISNRARIVMFNRSGDTCQYGSKNKSKSQNRSMWYYRRRALLP